MWPPAAVEFLRELEDNNDRDWFRANRKRYDELLLAPARELAEKLSHLGKPHFFRPYHDTRFRPGPPIKEQLGVVLGHGDGAGFYFELSLDGVFVAAGLHRPASDQLVRFRAAIDDARRATAFERALAGALAGGLEPAAPALKRAPKGYSPDHPRIERLRMRELTVSRRHRLGRWVHTSECDERIRSQLESARPLVRWLSKTVGPSKQPRRR